eukprot:TRINITY_DN10186_c0_g1_i2.p1 TRINITY_DN10186_c0_g1~~TRINITY_DN10186_c0_g1_i2.p1  ORF type:complete len:383 (+),score=89.35 TRINITY_DN10186_c0_g1_i2:150-1298(+)
MCIRDRYQRRVRGGGAVAMDRLAVLSKQLSPAPANGPVGSQSEDEHKVKWREAVLAYAHSVRELLTDGVLPKMSMYELFLLQPAEQSRQTLTRYLKQSEASGILEPLSLLPGPWQSASTVDEKLLLLHRERTCGRQGLNQQLNAEYQMAFGDCGLSSNVAVPAVTTESYSVEHFSDASQIPEGYPDKLRVSCRVIIGDPDDAERISRIHVRKEPNFGMFMDSVISTTDNEHWQEQRQHLIEAFLPVSSLAEILPVSQARAKKCADRLQGLIAQGPVVDMSDFLLHEAQAQLQLALLGAPEELMDATNAELRKTFMGDPRAVPGRLSEAMKELYTLAQQGSELALPSDGRAVRGPLSRALQTCLLYTSPSPRDRTRSRMPSSA